jgi:enamine deaminase RidA (YjgF/YER057c/UK114 family)
MSIAARLAELGIALPAPSAPLASYVPVVAHGGLAHVSGQLPFAEDGSLPAGLVGADIALAEAQAAARRCAIMILAQLQAAGLLERVERVVRLGVFVASAPGFREQHKVANGASDLLAEVLGEAGRHARSAVGVAELPLGVPVEVDAILALRP